MEFAVPYLGPSTNSIYGGIHFSKRSRHKNEALIALSRIGYIPPFCTPVDIEITPQLGKGKRAYDVSNYSYTYKLIEDALVHKKILVDDTPEYVRSVKFNSPVRTKDHSSTVLVKIQEATC